MIEVKITKEMLAKAKSKAKDMGTLRNSITKGAGNIAGFLGEEMILATYSGVRPDSTYDYDLSVAGLKIEVKCKRQASPMAPSKYYEASITDFNPNQKTDIYFFTRVNNEYTKGWIIGWSRKEDYFKKARFHKKGDYDPSNKFHFKCDCYNVPYGELMIPPTPAPQGNENA